MNKIRLSWKQDSKPFFFHCKFDSDYIHLSPVTCQKFDKIILDGERTAMDTLVDIAAVDMVLNRVSDPLVVSKVKDALRYCFNYLNYHVSLCEKSGAQR